MNISKHLAEHAVGELMQMGYTVNGDTLNPPEKLSDFACKFFGVAVLTRGVGDAALAAPADALAEPVGWNALLDSAQRPHQLNPRLHCVGFHDEKSADSWIVEQLDFGGWRYTKQALYPAPTATQLQQAVARAIEECAAICDAQHDKARTSPGAARADACARAIRAKGQQ